MKLLTATFEVENDLAEHNLRNVLEGMNVKYVKTLPNTDHLKEDKYFKSLLKDKKQAQKNIDSYIDKNRCI